MKKILSLLIALLMVALVFAGCSNAKTSDSQAATEETADTEEAVNTEETADIEEAGNTEGTIEEHTILVLPKLIGIPIFDAFENGAMDAGEDFGVNVIYTGPTAPDAAEQVKILEDYINQGVDCIAVAPNDPAAFSPVLTKAREKGILVMDWDTYADPELVDISVRQLSDAEFGKGIWDQLVKYMGDSGQYAIITGGLSAENLNTWIDEGLKYAETAYPNLELVTDKVPCDEKQQTAYQKALELIKAYPDLKGIVGISTPAPIGAAQAVQEKGLQDEITVVGTILPNDGKPFIEDGSLDAGLLYDPYAFMYACIYLAEQKLNGNDITDGMVIPNIDHAVTVEDNGRNVIFAPPMVFDKDNINDFDF